MSKTLVFSFSLILSFFSIIQKIFSLLGLKEKYNNKSALPKQIKRNQVVT